MPVLDDELFMTDLSSAIADRHGNDGVRYLGNGDWQTGELTEYGMEWEEIPPYKKVDWTRATEWRRDSGYKRLTEEPEDE
jgi:hypothetical protein